MASRRVAATSLADALVEVTGGDLEVAARLAEDEGVWRRVRAVLRDRLEHPDPFDSFPATPPR